MGLFATNPGMEWKFRWIYVGLIGLMLLVGIVVAFLKIHPELKRRISNLAWTNVFLGVVLYFVRDQRIPVLGMDLWRFMQEIGIVVWVNAIAWYARTGLRNQNVREAARQRFEKYLPKAK